MVKKRSTTDEKASDQADTDQSEESGTEPSKTAQGNVTPGNVSDDDKTSDVSEEELATASNAGAPVKQAIPEPNRTPYREGEHITDDFRSRVENTAAGDITRDIGPRAPYPEGNPQDPNWGYRQAHGHEPRRPEDNADPRPIGLKGLEEARGEHHDDWKRRNEGQGLAQGSAEAEPGAARGAGSRGAGTRGEEGERR
jgi:hypothetical protein